MHSKLKVLTNGLVVSLFMLLPFVFSVSSIEAAPHKWEGVIKSANNIKTKPPYNWGNKPTKGLGFGQYKYMVVKGITRFHGISYEGCKGGVYVKLVSQPEPPGMKGKPLSEIRKARYGCCEFATDVWKK